MDDFSLPGYVVDELVGFGGSGEVWRARDSSTGELVALKRLRSDAVTAMSTEQMQREAALLTTLRHDHIIALRAAVQTSGGLVLVLDYAEGGSLAALLGVRSRLSAGEVVTIGAPLAQALADIHARGLTHGDVAPGNIVFEGSGKPLLADLGVASLIGDENALVGRTPGYADPARVGADPATGGGAATDVHGLAAVCFSALCGSPPYGESDPLVARRLGPLAPGVPAALVAAIEAGLDPDPDARPDAAAFGRALFASCPAVAVRLVRSSQPVGAAAAPTTQVTTGSGRRVDAPSEPGPPAASRFRRVRVVGRHRWAVGRRALIGRVLAVACVVGLLSAAVAIGVVWGWADHGHGALASPASPADTASPASPADTASTASQVATAAPQPPPVPAAAASAAASSGIGPAPTPSDSTDWLSVMGGLDRSRDGAFADADANELDAIYVPGSQALATDRATLGRLVGSGQRVRGLQFALQSVRVIGRSPGEVTLTVADTLAGYEVVDAGGVPTPIAGRGVRNWTVVLRAKPAEDPGWLIASIAPA